MRRLDIKSLVWLCRWYDGRSQRSYEIHQAYLSNPQLLVVEELCRMTRDETHLTIIASQ